MVQLNFQLVHWGRRRLPARLLVNYLASNVVSSLDVAVPLYHHDSAELSMKSGRFSVSLSQKSTMVWNWNIIVPEHGSPMETVRCLECWSCWIFCLRYDGRWLAGSGVIRYLTTEIWTIGSAMIRLVSSLLSWKLGRLVPLVHLTLCGMVPPGDLMCRIPFFRMNSSNSLLTKAGPLSKTTKKFVIARGHYANRRTTNWRMYCVIREKVALAI